MNITIVCVGKIKEAFYRDALSEYAKRLSRYCKFKIEEVADEECKENASDAEEEAVKVKEGERLLKKIPASAYVYALAINGRKLDSVAFSKELGNLFVSGRSEICFVIGGSIGMNNRWYTEMVLEKARRYMVQPDIRVAYSVFGDDAGLYGAALLAGDFA